MLGRCQGNSALRDEGKGQDWIYVLDGPIDLWAKTDDGEMAQDVMLEAEEQKIEKLLTGMIMAVLGNV